MCGYILATKWQNFTEIYLAYVKTLLQVLGSELLFWLTLYSALSSQLLTELAASHFRRWRRQCCIVGTMDSATDARSIISCHLLRRNLRILKGGKSDSFAMLVLRSHDSVITDPPCSGRLAAEWWRVGLDQRSYPTSGPVSTGIGDRSLVWVAFAPSWYAANSPWPSFVDRWNEYWRWSRPRIAGENGEFCVTVKGMLVYWPSRLKALAVNEPALYGRRGG